MQGRTENSPSALLFLCIRFFARLFISQRTIFVKVFIDICKVFWGPALSPAIVFFVLSFLLEFLKILKIKSSFLILIVFVCIADFGKMLSCLHTMFQKKNSPLGKNKIIWKFKTFMALYHDFCKIQS